MEFSISFNENMVEFKPHLLFSREFSKCDLAPIEKYPGFLSLSKTSKGFDWISSEPSFLDRLKNSAKSLSPFSALLYKPTTLSLKHLGLFY